MGVSFSFTTELARFKAAELEACSRHLLHELGPFAGRTKPFFVGTMAAYELQFVCVYLRACAAALYPEVTDTHGICIRLFELAKRALQDEGITPTEAFEALGKEGDGYEAARAFHAQIWFARDGDDIVACLNAAAGVAFDSISMQEMLAHLGLAQNQEDWFSVSFETETLIAACRRQTNLGEPNSFLQAQTEETLERAEQAAFEGYAIAFVSSYDSSETTLRVG
ncbi:MAG: hypothetical protein KDD66_17260 [Bdellovibrionales bacterium]|nr:hypothetical protein [Bdellovibrionales bacterium]